MEHTGERCIPSKKGHELLELEHRARYTLASKFVEGKHVLDLGSGAGFGAAILAETAAHVIGIDISEESVNYSKNNYASDKLRFEVGDVCALKPHKSLRVKGQPELFDCITCFEVLEHVQEPKKLLESVEKLLAPEGIFIVSTPNINCPSEVDHENPFHIVEYSKDEFHDVLQSNFNHVVLAGQQNHLLSSIGLNPDQCKTMDTWRTFSFDDAKYFIAVCTNQKKKPAIPYTNLLTSDAHIQLLQSRLKETKLDQAFKGQRIELLERHLQDYLEAKSEDDTAKTNPFTEEMKILHGELHILQEMLEAQASQSNQIQAKAETRLQELNAHKQEIERLVKQILDQQTQYQDAQTRDKEEYSTKLKQATENFNEKLEEQSASFNTRQETLVNQHSKAITSHEALVNRHAETTASHEALVNRHTETTASHEALIHRHAETTASQEALVNRHAETIASLEVLIKRHAETIASLEKTIDVQEHALTKSQQLAKHNQQLNTELQKSEQTLKSNNHRLKEQLRLNGRRFSILHRTLTDVYRQFQLSNEHWWWRLGLKLRKLAAWAQIKRNIPIFPFDIATERMQKRDSELGQLSSTPHNSNVSLPVDEPDATQNSQDMQLLTTKQVKRLRDELIPLEQTKRVSIIMPTYNRAGVIEDAINSVLNQSYTHWELIIIDDGSTDSTYEIIQGYQDKHSNIHYKRNEHQGVSAARDTGLQQSTGHYIAYLDTDNTWLADYLLFMVNALSTNDEHCAYAGLRIFNRDNNNAVSYRKRQFNYSDLLKNNFIDINIFMHTHSIYEKLGGFDSQLKRWVDWDVILRYTKHHHPIEVPIILCDYNTGKTLNQITQKEADAYKYKVLSKHLVQWKHLEDEAPNRNHSLASIVIPVYNQLELTEQCVDSIHQHTQWGLFEIILVNNGSNPTCKKGLEALAAQYPNTHVKHNYENYMFALGNNIGVAETKGYYLILLNNDTQVRPGWLNALIRPLQEDSTIGLVGPKLLYDDNTIQAAGLVFSNKSKLPYHIYQHEPHDAPHVNKARCYQAMTGACMAMHTKDYIALRGFDARYINGGEDIDFCFRMQHISKRKLYYTPESVVLHHEGKTEGRGKAIQYNRNLFVQFWGEKVTPDDTQYYAEDGFTTTAYTKPGAEADGDTALYFPVLEANTVSGNPAGLEAPRILVVKPSGIGNMVMFTPALQALQEHLPQAHITIACYPPEAQVIEDMVDSVLRLEGRDPITGGMDTSELDAQISMGEYDIALYPPFTNLSKPTEHLLKVIPKHITHPHVDFTTRHEVLHNVDLVEQLGWDCPVPDMTTTTDTSILERLNLPEKLIGVHCGASSSEHMQKKKWPKEYFSQLIDLIPEEYTIILCGGPGDLEDSNEVVKSLKTRRDDSVIVLAGQLSLQETAAVIQSCRLFISNDSGLMHVSCAVDTSVIALFGPTMPQKNGPWSSTAPMKHRIATKDVPCRPCYKADAKLLMQCQDTICLNQLLPVDVIALVHEQLSTKSAKH